MHCIAVLIPPIKAGAKIQRSYRDPLKSHRLLGHAAQDDPFDPAGFSLNGKLYLMASQASQKPQIDLMKLLRLLTPDSMSFDQISRDAVEDILLGVHDDINDEIQTRLAG